MRPGPDDVAARGNLRRGVRVASFLAGTPLALEVPAVTVDFEESDDQDIPETLKLRVPVNGPGRASWDPTDDPEHPLACFGQRLYVVADTATQRGRSWETPLGWFLIDEWKVTADESAVEVTALGLLAVVAEDEFPHPEQPGSGATFASEVERLMTPGIPVSISGDLVDRAVPGSFTWDSDRLGALMDLAAAWPARLVAAADATVQVVPPLGVEPVPVLELTDGVRGVLIDMPRSDSRAGRYTRVAARSSEDTQGSAPVTGSWSSTTGPFATATYGRVSRRVASPLVSSTSAANNLAATVGEASQRQPRVFRVSMPPDVRVQLGDPVRLVWRGREYRGWVQRSSWPVNARQGAAPMVLEVGCPL